jgi:hypothetical protein
MATHKINYSNAYGGFDAVDDVADVVIGDVGAGGEAEAYGEE